MNWYIIFSGLFYMQVRRAGIPEHHQRVYGTIELLAAGTSTTAKTCNVDLKVIVILPGCCTSQHVHLRTESILYVEAGQVLLESVLAGERTVLNVGDIVVVDIAEDHRLTNEGPLPARVVEIQSPGYTKKDTVPLGSIPQRVKLRTGRFWDPGDHVRLKVCGIRTLEVAYACYELGVDAIGLHALGSKWSAVLSCEDWIAAVPEDLSIFLLTDLRRTEILASLVHRLRCTTIQLQGQTSDQQFDEVASAAKELGVKLVKTLPVPAVETNSLAQTLLDRLGGKVDAFLLDKGWYGGTGTTTDWNIARQLVSYTETPVILAGGLHEGNIAKACTTVKPFGVDVESSLEWRLSLEDGVVKPKSVLKIQRLVSSLRGKQ
ncbi:MAG: cupin domain-containing protein [Acidobacteriales bacterium]|nr:cupin domain-containing protein [Terriglobales bacterium]